MRPTAEVTGLATDVRLACMRIARRVRFENAGALAPHQFSALVRLEDSPRTPGELAEVERVSAPSMTRTLAHLEEKGLVRRSPHPTDGRQVLLALTDAGRATLAEVRAERDEWMATRLADLTAEERRTLREATAILARVAAR